MPPKPRLPAGLPESTATQAPRSLASVLGAASPHAPLGEGSAAPPHEMLPPGALPSEQEEAPPQPARGPTEPRAPLHQPSPAAFAAGFGGPSADAAAPEPAPAQPFVRTSLRERVPFGVREQQMAYPPIPGFHLHWFNDSPGRVRRAEMAGYAFVDGADGRPVTTVVGTDRAGKPLNAYLMKIRQEWFDEDMLAIEEEQRAILGAIKGGRFQPPAPGTKLSDQQATYIPAQGITVREGLRR